MVAVVGLKHKLKLKCGSKGYTINFTTAIPMIHWLQILRNNYLLGFNGKAEALQVLIL